MTKTYDLAIKCRNCGHRFILAINKSVEVWRGAIALEKCQMVSPFERERIYCPNCGSERLSKDKSSWPRARTLKFLISACIDCWSVIE